MDYNPTIKSPICFISSSTSYHNQSFCVSLPASFNYKNMEISTLYQIFLNCGTVTTDSRNCPKGSLFIALKGDSFNGNAFAAQALNDGCAYAVIDETGHNPKDDERYILVDNCLETLQQLANYHRRQLGTRIIGITGTNGHNPIMYFIPWET